MILHLKYTTLPCRPSSRHGTVAPHGTDRHMHALPRQMDADIGRVFLEKAAARHILSLGLEELRLKKKTKKKKKERKKVHDNHES